MNEILLEGLINMLGIIRSFIGVKEKCEVCTFDSYIDNLCPTKKVFIGCSRKTQRSGSYHLFMHFTISQLLCRNLQHIFKVNPKNPFFSIKVELATLLRPIDPNQ